MPGGCQPGNGGFMSACAHDASFPSVAEPSLEGAASARAVPEAQLDSNPTTARPGFTAIAVGGSTGSFALLRELVFALPADFGAALLVVLHVASDSPGLLPQLLTRPGGLEAHFPYDGEPLRPGAIYVAPPDHHLTVDAGPRLRLARGPRENRHRPAIDPLFRSLARVFGGQAVGVVLSGQLDDGAAGLFAISARGGRTLVQDPATATAPDMPRNALREVRADWVLPPAALAPRLLALVAAQSPRPTGTPAGDHARPSAYSCPECHGVLQESGHPPLFRCRTGHAYRLPSLAAEYSDAAEHALWIALRTLREKAALARRLGEHANSADSRERFRERERESEQQGDLVRNMIENLSGLLPQPTPMGE